MELIFLTMIICVIVSVLTSSKWTKLVPYVVALGLSAIFANLIFQLPVSTPLLLVVPWSDVFGASLVFKLDGLAMVMVVLISLIGTGVFLYAASYMPPMSGMRKFYAILTVFTAAMVFLVLSDNMLVFFMCWEATSICSFLLVGTKNHKIAVRESAGKALFITVGGGLVLLVGILMISAYGQEVGLSLSESLRFSMIDRSIISSPLYPGIVFCIAVAVATKSAQIPFHIWLPAAMAGPTPVSSFLHSATMVKAGVFLLARLTLSLGNNELWNTTFTTMGCITMVVGAILAASQRDIKRILAFSTIAVLGILVMLLGIGTDMAIKAAVVFLVAHALYKAALFQIIGNIDYATGNRDLNTLGSLARFMPLTAVAALLSALSKAGAPPLFGFYGKELAYLAKVQLGGSGVVLISLAVLTNILLVGLAISICYRPFWSVNKTVAGLKPVPIFMSLVPLTLSSVGLFIGIFPAFFDKYFGSQMASAITGKNLVMKLKLWHGVNLESLLVLALSIATLATGVFVAVKIKPIIAFLSTNTSRVQTFGPERFFDSLVSNIPKLASLMISKIQSGDLSLYIRWTLVSTVIVVAVPIFWAIDHTLLNFEFSWLDGIMFGAIAIPAAGTLLVKNKTARLILLGASGFGVVLTFSAFGAPDLALTQLLVEALVLIFVVLLFRSIRESSPPPKEEELGAYIVAIALGLCITLLLAIQIDEVPNDSKLFFLKNSYLEAFGKNVVNVILVDFRALDTFGEVVAVAIAALGCGSLLIKKKGKGQHG